MKKLLTVLCLLVLAAPLFAQNPDFERKYQVAHDLYNKGQYEKARTAINNTLKNLPSLSSSQIQKGKNLASQCDQAIANRDRLDLAKTTLEIPFGSGIDSIGFVAAKPQLVKAVSSASWCKVEKVENGNVYLHVDMNPDKKLSRQATITISMGKIKTRKATVVQDARPETVKQVSLRTKPDRARVSVDGSMPITGSWEGKLDSGPHKIHVEKSGYFSRDTVINVVDDMRADQNMDIVLQLAPSFGKLKVEVLPQEGFSFDDLRPYELIVNGRTIENFNYSYDDDRDIERYFLYEDGTIPVPPGLLTVAATAKSFEQERRDVQIKAGEVIPLTLVLKAKFGRLSLIDTGQARNAVASIDGKPAGAVQDITNYPVSVGEHAITLEKEGFQAVESSYVVNIHENEDVILNVAMTRFVPYIFDSNPADAKVIVDGEYIGNTPTKPYLLRESEPGKTFQIEIIKDGYLSAKETLAPDFKNYSTQTKSFTMPKTNPLKVTTDGVDLQLIVKNSRHGDTTFVEGVTIPAEVALPLRDKPYYVELHRIGQTYPAYRGRLKFNDASKTKHYIQSWSKSELVPLAVSTNFVGSPNPVSVAPEGLTANNYNLLGTVNLLRFRIFHGLSTSVLKGMIFLPVSTPNFAPTAISATTKTPEIVNPGILPAVTCLFLNADLRIGGAVLDYMDVDFLATYAWYPTFLKKFIPFSHISGHDVFVGAEVSSRIPYFNVSLRVGMQMYPMLTANLCDSSNTSNETEAKFTSAPLNIPNMFVIGVEIALFGKGNSIWRVF